jgi:NAD-dependent histone deacetylase SIR2
MAPKLTSRIVPDFRSTDGLFKSLQKKHNLKASGKLLFDAAVYQDDALTAPFHEMVRSLSVEAARTKPTKFHEMLARLGRESRLKRLYTQNIDGLETSMKPLETEIPLNVKGRWPVTIQLHGSITKMVCQKCRYLSDFVPSRFCEADPPECDECSIKNEVRTTTGQRSHGIGRMRPRIVLYNEHNPDEEAITSVMNADIKSRPRVLVVAGTSLKIPGVRRLVKSLCPIIRSRKDGVTMFINNEPPVGKEFENCFDLIVQGSTDDVADLVKLKHWEDCTPYDMLPEPVFGSKHSSDEESEVEQKSTVSVVINSTPKKRPLSDTGLFTPSSSHDEKPPAKKLANPASRGRNLNDVLKGSKTTAPAKPGRKKAAATGTKKAKAEPAKTAKITTFSRVTKASKPAATTEKKTVNGKPMRPLPAGAARNNGLLFPNLVKKAGVNAPEKLNQVLPEIISTPSS